MGKTVSGSSVAFAVKKLLLAGFVLGMVAHVMGDQVSLELIARPRAGAVYTRWGRTVCPSDATLVYKGVMGAVFQGTEGGGHEYLCLTDQPEWGKDARHETEYTGIGGVEYKAGEELFDKDNAPKLIDHDAVCAVCRSARSVQVMIPGKRSCIEGWTREYYGYLMTASKSSPGATNYICMDHAPEVAKNGYRKRGGPTLIPVGGSCRSSLPCPPYVDRKILTCVVCSQ